MRPDRLSSHERHEANQVMGRELARRLAVEAARIALTLEQLAAVHESLAGSDGHPLSVGAADRAVAERRMAARERAASVWFTSIADGSFRRPGEASQRLPSQ